MFLLRHGQSLFNQAFTLTRRDPGIEDPVLTEQGHAEARAAAVLLAAAPITRIIVSPYTRALQTAAAVLAVHDVPVEVMEVVRERTAFACDIGRAPAALAADFPRQEFGHLPARWWHDGIESAEETIARADTFRALMAARADEAGTLVVSHWGFILCLTGISVQNGEELTYDPHQPAPAEIVWRH